jgi:hypothetical protein
MTIEISEQEINVKYVQNNYTLHFSIHIYNSIVFRTNIKYVDKRLLENTFKSFVYKVERQYNRILVPYPLVRFNHQVLNLITFRAKDLSTLLVRLF